MDFKRRVEQRKDGLYLEQIQITNFVPVLTKIKKILSSDGCRYKFTIFLRSSVSGEKVVEVEDLFVKSWFDLASFCADAHLSNRERKMIQVYLQEQISLAETEFEISPASMGWTQMNEGIIFCTKDTAIFHGMPRKYALDFSGRQIEAETFRCNLENCGMLLRKIQKLNDGVSWILFIASHIGFLKALFEEAGYPVEFIFNIFGASGSGKTSLLKAAVNFGQVFSFRSHKRRDVILKELETCIGGNVLVDDFHPAESRADRERQSSLKDFLTRLVEENGSAPNIFITSEFLDGHFSMQDRELQLFVGENIDWELLGILRGQEAELKNIRIAFMVQVIKHRGEVVSEIRKYCGKADAKDFSEIKSKFRSSRYISYISCANYLFEKYFIGEYGVELHTYDIEADLEKQLAYQIHHMAKLKSIEQYGTYLVVLRDMLMDRNILANNPNWIEFIPSADTLHINSKGRVCISYQALYHGIMKYMNTTKVSVKKIVSELREAEALVCYEDSRDLTKIHNGKRYYEIDTDALNEYCAMFE